MMVIIRLLVMKSRREGLMPSMMTEMIMMRRWWWSWWRWRWWCAGGEDECPPPPQRLKTAQADVATHHQLSSGRLSPVGSAQKRANLKPPIARQLFYQMYCQTDRNGDTGQQQIKKNQPQRNTKPEKPASLSRLVGRFYIFLNARWKRSQFQCQK